MENEKKLTRSSNRMIAGVCAGIADISDGMLLY